MIRFFLICLLMTDIVFALDELPKLKSTACQFKQTKTFSSTTLVSGGNFQFIEGKGVVFNTTYPVKMTTSYLSSSNRQINDIILAVSRKDYSYLERNFDINYTKSSDWRLALTPKNSTIKTHLKSILIDGNENVKRIFIDTVNNGKTDILFNNCGK